MAKSVADLSGVMIRPPKKGEAQGIDPTEAVAEPTPPPASSAQETRDRAGQGGEQSVARHVPVPAQQSILAMTMPMFNPRSHLALARVPSGASPRKKIQFEVDEVVADWIASVAHELRKKQQHVLEALAVEWVTSIARSRGVNIDGTPISES